MLKPEEKCTLIVADFVESGERFVRYFPPNLGDVDYAEAYVKDGKYILDYTDVVYAGDYSDSQMFDSFADLIAAIWKGNYTRV